MLVVTKADLGQVALNARRDLSAALRSLGRRATRVLAVTSLPPATGVEELLDGARAAPARARTRTARQALAERRLRARRAGALTAFTVEHGERGLRTLGGRRAAERWLAEQGPALDEVALVAALERRMHAGGSDASARDGARPRRRASDDPRPADDARSVRAGQRARRGARRGEPRHGAGLWADGIRAGARLRAAEARDRRERRLRPSCDAARGGCG